MVFGLGATRVLKTHLLRVCPLFLLKLPLAISDISHMFTVVIECVVVNATLDLAHTRTNIRHCCLLFLVSLITSLVFLSESLISFLLQLFLLGDLVLDLLLTSLVELVLTIPCRHESNKSLRLGTLE